MGKKRNAGNLKLLAGQLCLDFTNTLDWRGTDIPQEFLNTYHDLAIWSRHAGITTLDEVKQLDQMAERSPSGVKPVLKKAIHLRETLYRIFFSIAENHEPSIKDLAVFNKALSDSMKDSRIILKKKAYVWDTAGNKSKPDWILNPIVRSAADLLVSNDLKRVKACADPACGWLFLDVSRNRRRRWCDMQDCGNRAKASRFYRKKARSDR